MAFRIGRKFAYHTYPEPDRTGGLLANRQEGSLTVPANQDGGLIIQTPFAPFNIFGVIIKPEAAGDFIVSVSTFIQAEGTDSSARFQLIGLQGTAALPLLLAGNDPPVGFYQGTPLVAAGVGPFTQVATSRILLDTISDNIAAPATGLATPLTMTSLPAFGATCCGTPTLAPAPVAASTNFPAARGKVWFGIRVVHITGSDIFFPTSPDPSANPPIGPIGTFFAQEV